MSWAPGTVTDWGTKNTQRYLAMGGSYWCSGRRITVLQMGVGLLYFRKSDSMCANTLNPLHFTPRGECQTRCACGAFSGIVVWTVSAVLKAACCWRLFFCPKLYLTPQKELGYGWIFGFSCVSIG